MQIHKPSLRDTVASLKRLAAVEVPEGDNEGDSFNACAHSLSDSDYETYREALDTAYAYVRNGSGEPDRRSIRALSRNGMSTSLDVDQYDPLRLAGRIRIQNRWLDIGDPQYEDVPQ